MRSHFAAWTGVPLAVVLLAVVLAAAGCGNDRGFERVTGEVTLGGQPIETGAIMFVPVDGSSQTTGGTITNGRYLVEVPAGAMKVSISAPKIVGKKKIYDTPDSPEMPVTEEAVPARFNEQTELTLEVVAGKNEKDFHLPVD